MATCTSVRHLQMSHDLRTKQPVDASMGHIYRMPTHQLFSRGLSGIPRNAATVNLISFARSSGNRRNVSRGRPASCNFLHGFLIQLLDVLIATTKKNLCRRSATSLASSG